MLAIPTKILLIALYFYRCSAEENDLLFAPLYHVYPGHGWMNDPNGFCKYKDDYHLFYQYNPESSQEPGTAHWGHAKSTDLVHWKNLPIAMYPDQWYDENGVFSGSALIENDTMYLFYTGNKKNPASQRQALAISTNGVDVTKYKENPVIEGEDYQPNIRDPKVWKHGDCYYMVLGNSFNNDTLGRVLLYSSKDLISWKMESVLAESDGDLGYMWECPDFFELDGYFVLLFSPQGIEPQGDDYKNLYQVGYLVGSFDYDTHLFKPLTKFVELDRGHDFYATQTFLNDDYRRILFAWGDSWGNKYPERDDGWTGLMTLTRTISLTKDLRIIQKPVEELIGARGCILYSGKPQGGHTIKLEDKAGEIILTAPKDKHFNLFIESTNVSVSISYDFEEKTVTLDRGGEDGVRRTKWEPEGKLEWRIYVDVSFIELFCGEGEVTFSSRFFPYGDVVVRLEKGAQVDHMDIFSMQRTMERPNN